MFKGSKQALRNMTIYLMKSSFIWLLQVVNGKKSINKHDSFIYKCLEIRSINTSLV